MSLLMLSGATLQRHYRHAKVAACNKRGWVGGPGQDGQHAAHLRPGEVPENA